MSNRQLGEATMRLLVGVCITTALLFAKPAHAAIQYVHTDALGSPVTITDEERNTLARNEYEPYGKLLSGSINDSPGFTGHVSDIATGLSYMQQRYYDPEIGKFLSIDPVTVEAGSGGNFNRYKYANNNPYRFTDPDGRKEKDNNGSFILGMVKALRDAVMTVAHAMVDPDGSMIDVQSDQIGPGPGPVEQGGYKFGSALIAAEGARGLGKAPGSAAAGEKVALTKGQAANLARFQKKLPAANTGTTVTRNGKSGVTFTSEVPGRVPGSSAIYQKTVDASGTTTSMQKTTVSPSSQVIHVKDKMN